MHADIVAAKAREVLLCDAAATVAPPSRGAQATRIRTIAPEEVERHGEASFDLVFANSLVQYLTGAELDQMLALWRRLLAPGGTLIVADVIPPDVSAVSDVIALLRYAVANVFLGAALIGLVRTALSPYRKLRNELGIARYTEPAFLARLGAAGFAAERMGRNVEHNQARMTFRARRA